MVDGKWIMDDGIAKMQPRKTRTVFLNAKAQRRKDIFGDKIIIRQNDCGVCRVGFEKAFPMRPLAQNSNICYNLTGKNI